MEVLGKWLKVLLGLQGDFYDAKQFLTKVTRLVSQHQKLVVARNQQGLKEFNESTFSSPISDESLPLNREPDKPCKIPVAPKTVSKQDYETVQSVNESLAREVTALKTFLQEEKEKVPRVQNKLKKHNPRNAQKRE